MNFYLLLCSLLILDVLACLTSSALAFGTSWQARSRPLPPDSSSPSTDNHCAALSAPDAHVHCTVHTAPLPECPLQLARLQLIVEYPRACT